MPSVSLTVVAGKHRKKIVMTQLKNGIVSLTPFGPKYYLIDLSYQGQSVRNIGKSVVGGVIGHLLPGGMFMTAVGAAIGGRSHDRSLATLTLQKVHSKRTSKIIVKAKKSTLKHLMRFSLYVQPTPEPIIVQQNIYQPPLEQMSIRNNENNNNNTKRIKKPSSNKWKYIGIGIGVLAIISLLISLAIYIFAAVAVVAIAFLIYYLIQRKSSPSQHQQITTDNVSNTRSGKHRHS